MVSDPPTISVVVPSRGASPKLARCLDDLARQTHAPLEILLGLDGATERAADEVRDRFGPVFGGRLHAVRFDKVGLMPIRKTLLGRARGEIFLSINDDVRFDEHFVAAHANAHTQHNTEGRPAIISGATRWCEVENPTLFDHAIQRSDMIFFRPDPSPDGSLTYRECYGINFSAPVRHALEAGGFAEHANTYGYEDIELAYRMGVRGNAVVKHAPDALLHHDHRYGPEDTMRREYELGRAAWLFGQSSPEFTRHLFGRRIACPEELGYWRATIRRNRRDAERIEQTMLRLAKTPADSMPDTPLVGRVLAEHWVVLKRFLWGWGLLDQAADRERRWSLLARAGKLP